MEEESVAAPLAIRGLEVRLHQRDQVVHALRGVDFDVARGEIVALVGESGSGKSTLSLAVQGLLSAAARPEVEGSILVDGEELVGAPPSTLRRIRRERVRAIFQDPMTSLNPTMRVGRQLTEAALDDRPPEHWLERVGIAQPARRVSAFPHELSGGERQRVMIAMAMSGRPSLVLADEPTTATISPRATSRFTPRSAWTTWSRWWRRTSRSRTDSGSAAASSRPSPCACPPATCRAPRPALLSSASSARARP